MSSTVTGDWLKRTSGAARLVVSLGFMSIALLALFNNRGPLFVTWTGMLGAYFLLQAVTEIRPAADSRVVQFVLWALGAAVVILSLFWVL